MNNQKGQSLVEYLIIVALVGISTIAVMKAVGQNINVQYAKIVKALGGDVEGSPKAAPVSESMYRKKDLRNFLNGAVNNKNNENNEE